MSVTFKRRALGVVAAATLAALGFSACTTTPASSQSSTVSTQASIDAQIRAGLSHLYRTVPGSRELVARSAGVLVFPAVGSASLIVGGEHGRGALQIAGRTVDYYSTTAASIGLQAGAQSRAVFYVFTTTEALNQFRASNGWTAGVDATVALARMGANASVDTETAKQPVVGFTLTNAGLEAGVSLQGAKIRKITP